ncbi:hypothetical protein [Streptomyces sp. ICBB 8177]|uniref:hypothetical protein n=1 Tax=Streptomyces sp. ICBB 8177 TaxID=563922 RepID=UPI000D67293C|nr:hypothetical protein [Streptomyces sp. ICBB 8177]PWI41144.1 hypothetical protein CK485_27780 [Streptomyces sp. ICBB 8177]
MSTYRQERRADQAAAAEQARADRMATEHQRAERQRLADERAARLREQARADRQAARTERTTHRQERAERRAQALTPERVYRNGTLALVVASGLASLPAQVLHFAGISLMLLPVPLGLEGAAWVMAAGVAFADARRAPVWVRWLLRALVAVCAGFAASINYGYGLSLHHPHGLSAADASTAGLGLAAVTLLGPLVFEIRQWVATCAVRDPAERDRRRHARRRRRDHRDVSRIARRLVSAAPFGTLGAEEAWAQAWAVVHGTDTPGMTPRLHRAAVAARTRLAESRVPAGEEIARRLHAALATPATQRGLLLPELGNVIPLRGEKPQVTSQMPTPGEASAKGSGKRPSPPRRRKGDTPKYHRAARAAAAETARRPQVSANV